MAYIYIYIYIHTHTTGANSTVTIIITDETRDCVDDVIVTTIDSAVDGGRPRPSSVAYHRDKPSIRKVPTLPRGGGYANEAAVATILYRRRMNRTGED